MAVQNFLPNYIQSLREGGIGQEKWGAYLSNIPPIVKEEMGRQMETLKLQLEQAHKAVVEAQGTARVALEGQRVGLEGQRVGLEAGKPITTISGEEEVQYLRQPDGSMKEVGRGPRFAKQVASVVNIGGQGAEPTTDTLEMDAWRYLSDGTLPPNMGRGVQGVKQATLIRNRASEMAKEMGTQPDEIRFGQMMNKTQVGTIAQLARARAQILQFEKTAEYNADLALKASEKVNRTGVPVFNRWLQAGRSEVLGDPDTKVFNAAMETFIMEYARVMSGGYGAAQTTEGAQQRAHQLLNTSGTKEQVTKVIGQLKTEMGNRVKALDDQMTEEKRRLRGGLPSASAAAGSNGFSASTQPSQSGPKVGEKRTINGTPAHWDGKGWLAD
jgi:hypothetical protein